MKSEELRMENKDNKKPVVLEKSFDFSLRVIRFYQELKKQGGEAVILGRQLLRSGTSIGANIHEAQGGQSKADFIAKMSIAHKESLETLYWLRLIQESGVSSGCNVQERIEDAQELIRILSSILLTSKNSRVVSSRF